MKKRLIAIGCLLGLLIVVTASASDNEGIRMLGRAGAGVGFSAEQDSMYGNPAGLAGVRQSFLQQTYSQTGLDKTYSQSFVLAVADSAALGGLVNLQMDNATEKICAFPSLSASTRLFNFISLGGNAYNISAKPVYSIGAIAGFKSPQNRIAILEAGIYHENVKADLFFDRNNFSRPQTSKATTGAHLRLRTDDGAFIDMMFDTVYIENFKEIPFSQSVKRAAIEQTYHFGESSSLSMRTGIELPTTGSAVYSVGLGWKAGFISVDAGVRMNQNEDDHFGISATFLLAEKGDKSRMERVQKMKEVVSDIEQGDSEKIDHLTLGNAYNSLKCSISPSQGFDKSKIGFIININNNETIGSWKIHLIDINSHKIVKTYSGQGAPPAAFQIDINSLPNSKYRADLSLVTEDLSQTGSSESTFVKNGSVIAANNVPLF